MRSALTTSILVLATSIAVARPRVAREDRNDDKEDKEDKEDEGEGPEGQAILPIKLDDLIEATVQRNPDLVRAKIERVAALSEAQASRRDQAWIGQSGINYKKFALAEAVEVGPGTKVGEDTWEGSIGLGRKLPTGGEFNAQLAISRSLTEILVVTSRLRQSPDGMTGMDPAGAMPEPEEFALNNTAAVKLTLKQPLARGFGPGVALAPERKADLGATQATVKAQLAAEEAVRDNVSAYWDLALAAYEVDVRAQSLQLAKKQEELTHEQMRGGMVPQTALNAVTYEIQVRQEALLRAQIELENKSLDMRRKAGLRLDRRQILMRPGEPFEIGDDDFQIDEMIARAHAANHKLADNQLQKKIADIDVRLASDQVKPQLDLTFGGSLSGVGSGAADSIGAIGASYEVSVGLQLQWELSAAARRHRDAAVAGRKVLDVVREDLERQIDAQVVNAVKMVSSSRVRVGLADKAIQVAEENVRAERASFMLNKTTNFEVMKRQSELIEARLRRGNAVADYHKAVAQLQFLSGVILEQYRVNVRPHSEALARIRTGGDRK